MADARRTREYKFHFLYRKIKCDYCMYCGEIATLLDHVPPLAIVESQGPKANMVLVPSCEECNSFGWAHPDYTIRDRKKRIGELIFRKYRRLLNSPSWTQDELNELGPEMRQRVMRAESQKLVIQRRIAFASHDDRRGELSGL